MLNVLTEKQVEEAFSKPIGSSAEVSRMKAWLDERVAKGRKTPHSEVVTLTPVLAALLLERNDGNNRNISKHNIESIKNDILSDRWLFNGESIVISNTGLLLDGQHRCEAVVQTRKAIQVNLSFGAKEEARFTIDIGRPKSAANFLQGLGFTDCTNLAATIALILEYQKSQDIPKSYARATKTAIVQSASDLRGIQASVDLVQGATARGLGSRSILAFCHFQFKKRAGVVVADEFITKLIDGDGLRKGDPIYHLRDRLLTMRGQVQQSLRCGLIFRTWNHWRLNESVNKIVAPHKLPRLER